MAEFSEWLDGIMTSPENSLNTKAGAQCELRLTTVPCPICKVCAVARKELEPQSHWTVFRQQFRVSRCTHCGTLALNPRPDPESLMSAYGYLDREAKSGNTVQRKAVEFSNEKGLVKSIWRSMNDRNRKICSVVKIGPVLDVGCGEGQLVRRLSELGFEAKGFDFSEDAVRKAQQSGLDVEFADISDMQIERGAYKTIIMSHVLEHMQDPVKSLETLSERLGHDGKIIIAVPNSGSLMRYVFRKHWHGWDPPFHLVHFDKNSVQRIASRLGLSVVRLYTIGDPEEITRSWQLWRDKSRRYLGARIVLWPFTWGLAKIGLGSELIVILERQ